jgi:cytochrome P450
VDELLRVLAPAPLLPRVAAGDGVVGGRPVRRGDRLVLVARHAAGAHRTGPDPAAPAPPQVSQLVFGAGPHACPGARLARAQLADALAALAPHRPVVSRLRVDRTSALPGWSTVEVRAG